MKIQNTEIWVGEHTGYIVFQSEKYVDMTTNAHTKMTLHGWSILKGKL